MSVQILFQDEDSIVAWAAVSETSLHLFWERYFFPSAAPKAREAPNLNPDHLTIVRENLQKNLLPYIANLRYMPCGVFLCL